MKNKNFNKILFNILCNCIIITVLGIIVETIVGIFDKVIFKEEFGFVIGPLWILYGIIFNIIIFILNKWNFKKIKFIVLGSFLGIIFEYIISFMIEAFLGIKFWNTNNLRYQLNGRVGLLHIILSCILFMVCIKINKLMKKNINKFSENHIKTYNIIISIFLVMYSIFIFWSIIIYRNIKIDKLNEKNYTSNNNVIEKVENYLFSEKNMKVIYKKFEIQ